MSDFPIVKTLLVILFPVLWFLLGMGGDFTGANFAHADSEWKTMSEGTIDHEDNAKVKIVKSEKDQPPMEVQQEMDPVYEADQAYEVQAVLSAKRKAVISGAMDGVLKKVPFENGDLFKKGDILAQYICDFEAAKVREIQARLRASARKIDAFQRLKTQDAVADVEYISVKEEHEQLKAVLQQSVARRKFCSIKAPFDGRVTDKLVSNHEAVKSGRVMMEISSLEPLQAELLIPSMWLRWLNTGASLHLRIHETGKDYDAEIIGIHGQVDPVTQTVRVVAEISEYEEELLPGMTGKAIFQEPRNRDMDGFLGVKVQYE